MTLLNVCGRYYQATPPKNPKRRVEEHFHVDFNRAALLVVDIYGHGFTESEPSDVEDHPYADKELNKEWDDITLKYIRPALEAARLAGMPVIYTHNSAPNIEINRSEFGKQLRRSFETDLEELLSENINSVDPLEYKTREGAHLLKIAPAVAPRIGDYYIRKHFYSGFKDTRLDTLLRNLEIKTLFCVGFDSSVCLLCTMIDAWELNYEIVLLRDAAKAMEMPEDKEAGYSFTDRMLLWVETMLGRSITTKHFVELMASIEPKAGDICVG